MRGDFDQVAAAHAAARKASTWWLAVPHVDNDFVAIASVLNEARQHDLRC